VKLKEPFRGSRFRGSEVQGSGVRGRGSLPSPPVMAGRMDSGNSIAVETAIWIAESYHENEIGYHEISYVNSGLIADSAGASNSLLDGN
jgi:hypothetical protein